MNVQEHWKSLYIHMQWVHVIMKMSGLGLEREIKWRTIETIIASSESEVYNRTSAGEVLMYI